MSAKINVQIVKNFLAAIGHGDKEGVLARVADDVEWIIPGRGWPLAGTHRGYAGVAELIRKASNEVEITYPTPPEYVARGDRVLVIGVATGRIKATNKPFKDEWVFDIKVRDDRLIRIQEYIDTQALAQAAKADTCGSTPG